MVKVKIYNFQKHIRGYTSSSRLLLGEDQRGVKCLNAPSGRSFVPI
jgi:hypothetical protein